MQTSETNISPASSQSTEWEEVPVAAAASEPQDEQQEAKRACQHCNRTFFESRILKHEAICQKVQTKPFEPKGGKTPKAPKTRKTRTYPSEYALLPPVSSVPVSLTRVRHLSLTRTPPLFGDDLGYPSPRRTHSAPAIVCNFRGTATWVKQHRELQNAMLLGRKFSRKPKPKPKVRPQSGKSEANGNDTQNESATAVLNRREQFLDAMSQQWRNLVERRVQNEFDGGASAGYYSGENTSCTEEEVEKARCDKCGKMYPLSYLNTHQELRCKGPVRFAPCCTPPATPHPRGPAPDKSPISCGNCGRDFKPAAWDTHQRVCKKGKPTKAPPKFFIPPTRTSDQTWWERAPRAEIPKKPMEERRKEREEIRKATREAIQKRRQDIKATRKVEKLLWNGNVKRSTNGSELVSWIALPPVRGGLLYKEYKPKQDPKVEALQNVVLQLQAQLAALGVH
eukprot:TRINITY_DN66178_c3_g1_i2.p1 TRINITY_DN66178_c3_g1~~TRINITY_DN66178_c3_g1_i2.p1  ORF type:complete len:452 (-),score=25.86 TRINITY_DN66178_c3_g1_i2:247-1602(-)